MSAAGDIVIAQAAGAPDVEAARRLFLEYAEALDFDLCFQGFDDELASLPGAYAPPGGRLLLARAADDIAGCVGLRPLDDTPLDDTMCEMKRLYIRPAHRGSGLGRRLAKAVIAEASAAGYAAMRLDTIGASMKPAQALYADLGFVEIAPYYPSPADQLRYFELRLA